MPLNYLSRSLALSLSLPLHIYLHVYNKCILRIKCTYLQAQDAFELALSGFRPSVEGWGLPTRLEWVSAPDRGERGIKLVSRLDAWASGVCIGLEPGTEDLLLRHGVQSLGRALGVTPQGLLGIIPFLGAFLVSVVWRGTP